MSAPEIIICDSVASTNSHPALLADGAPAGLTVATREQTAGRGQRGNHWESAPGLNLTFSTLLRPSGRVAPKKQFLISMAVAVATARCLQTLLDNEAACHHTVKVKWPNDIYVGDRKICGILIENIIQGGELSRCIVGVGLNVNQTKFVSDAPNPVSIANITGRQVPLMPLLESLSQSIAQADIVASADDGLPRRYNAMLWRGDGGYYPWRETATDRLITARIDSVAPTGFLTLVTDSGERRTFAFKEVAAVL